MVINVNFLNDEKKKSTEMFVFSQQKKCDHFFSPKVSTYKYSQREK